MFVSRFFWPTVKLLPLDITGEITDYEFLLTVCRKIKEIIEVANLMGEQVNDNKEAIDALQLDVKNIETEIEKVKNGDYFSLYLEGLISYINNNLKDIVGNVVKFVVFGLDQEGYFVAMVPESWQFLHFSTIVDPTSEYYGQLILQW